MKRRRKKAKKTVIKITFLEHEIRPETDRDQWITKKKVYYFYVEPELFFFLVTKEEKKVLFGELLEF